MTNVCVSHRLCYRRQFKRNEYAEKKADPAKPADLLLCAPSMWTHLRTMYWDFPKRPTTACFCWDAKCPLPGHGWGLWRSHHVSLWCVKKQESLEVKNKRHLAHQQGKYQVCDALAGHSAHRSPPMESWPWRAGHLVPTACCSRRKGEPSSAAAKQPAAVAAREMALFIWQKPLHVSIYTSVPSPTPCLNEKSGPSWHEAAHARCWAVNETDAARGTKEVII